ncbi:MAG: sulfatase-like hydrolase/transferase, partial [Thermogutta sp.]
MRFTILKSELVAFLSGIIMMTGVGLARAENSSRPNILFLLADDLGWGDLSCYGNRKFRTPNLDRLAREGVLFTQYYQAGSVCSPTRAALMTGRYPAELSIHGHLATHEQNAARDMPDFLDPEIPTLPKLLKRAGYTTVHVGKWHLGRPEPTTPRLEPYGFDLARWIDCQEGERNLWHVTERPVAARELVDATIQTLREIKDRPFYCQLWFNDPHALLAPSAEQMAPLRRQVPEGFTSPFMVYAATVIEMDRQIGRLLHALDELGLAKNTLVIFSSDNGPEDIDV